MTRPETNTSLFHGRPDVAVSRIPSTDAYRVDRSLVVVLFLAALNAPGLVNGQSPIWYVLLAFPFVAIALVRVRLGSTLIRRPVFSDVVLLILMILGLAGTTYGVLFLGTTAPLRPTFVPMVIALLYLGTLDQPTEQESLSLLRGLIWVGVAYLLVNISVSLGIAPGPGLNGDHPFRNSQLLFVGLAVVGAISSRRWAATLLLALLVTYMIITYPSGTTILVAAGTLTTLYITQPRASAIRGGVVAVLAVMLVSISLMKLSATQDVTERYFAAVGKQNNDATRLASWNEGMDRFWRSPIIGAGFADNTYVQVVIVPGQPVNVQFNNDFILFLAEGGVMGLGLLLVWAVATEVTIIRRYRMFVRAGWPSHARLLRTLLVGWNAFFVAAAVNPQFSAVTGSASIFAVYGLMMSLGTPPPEGERA
jgi:hypothetical protein